MRSMVSVEHETCLVAIANSCGPPSVHRSNCRNGSPIARRSGIAPSAALHRAANMTITPPPALPHGALTEVLPDVFLVVGSMALPGPGIRFSRNMTVVRQGAELILINSLRLSDAGLLELDKLGKVTHVIRLAGFHGRDDAFYRERYGARVSCIRGQAYSKGFGKPTPEAIYFTADTELTTDSALPIPDAKLYVFDSVPPEAMLVLARHGGTVIAGDALQNWAEADAYFSWVGKVMMKMMGFLKRHNVGPGWLKQARPSAASLSGVLDLAFENLLPAHGAPVLGAAKERYRPSIERAVATLSAGR